MHDPMTVAFDIRYPWLGKPCKLFPDGYRDTFITIWHVDPEKDGDESSCWRDHHFRWTGWRWHFWHWKIQIHPLQNLKRWLFSRCAGCGKGFSWGYCPVLTGEDRLFHHECYSSRVKQEAQWASIR
jgi:hypothetical protein